MTMTDTLYDHIDTTDDSTSYRDRLVGEGKKFKDDEALARGKWEGDMHINRLEGEMSRLRKDLNERVALEELVNKLGANRTTSTPDDTNSGMERDPAQQLNDNSPKITKDEITQLVKNTLQEEDSKKSQERNLAYCAAELKKLYGTDWVNKLRTNGTALGLSEEYMDNLAKTAPKALLTIMSRNNSSSVDTNNITAPRSSVASITMSNGSGDLWSQYEKMRKENPRLYWSPKVQMQLHKDTLSGKIPSLAE